MTKAHPQLFLIETDAGRARALTAELSLLSQVTVVESYAEAAEVSGGLDALYVSLMSAIEWGSIPIPAPVHETRVVKMPEDMIALGRPQYAIPGVATYPREVLTPAECARLVLRESFRAIDFFNRTNSQALTKIGAVSSSLCLTKLKTGEALEILREAYSHSP
jgi:hypothetical protein